PTRVLDLGSNNSRLTAPIRLRITDFGEKGDYFTLSYRWGARPWFTTTRETLTTHCQRIDLNDMPKIFGDAVMVARRMSVQYLWIDALCILQDDLSDWSQESAQMGEIYQNSLCTLAIHHPSSNTEGFLSSALKEPQIVEVNLRPASQRGWVLQERFLSMRILHFAKSEIYWEDSSYSRVEAKNRPWSAVDEWLNIVERYSLCYLTKESDKLPAIAGIASNFQKRTGYSYFAGIWSEDIHCGLLWLGINAKLRRPKTRRAPSWAWPCYDGPLHF
ncbi:heterokaryon incompatibility protein-domain-containing protein, partial [Leptodontidium sp. 2 PMI_412]